jgi:hypothetical protein
MTKIRFSSCLANDEIATHGYMTLTFVKCTTIMIVELTVMSSLGSSQDYMVWFGYGMVGMIFCVSYVEPCNP